MQPYDPFARDIWALGVLLYRMLEGHMPFGEPFKVKTVPTTISLLWDCWPTSREVVSSTSRRSEGATKATRNGPRASPAGLCAKFAANRTCCATCGSRPSRFSRQTSSTTRPTAPLLNSSCCTNRGASLKNRSGLSSESSGRIQCR